MAGPNGRSLQRYIVGLVGRSSTVTCTSRATSDGCCSTRFDGNRITTGLPKFWAVTNSRFLHSSSSSGDDTLASNSRNNRDDNRNSEEWVPPSQASPAVDDTVETASGTLGPSLDDVDNDTEEWIPPERPLAGDKGQSHVYAHVEEQGDLKQLEKELQQLENDAAVTATTTTTTTMDDQQAKTTTGDPLSSDGIVPDWLKTRRQRLQGTDLMKPQDSIVAKQNMLSEIPVLKHTFLTRKEIFTVIESMGGQDVACILDDLKNPRMAGATGLIITTGATHAQIRSLAEALLRQLRLRKLEECDVIGAKEGIEGNVGDPYEDWLVLDCENYVVHFQTPLSRKALNIEGLWSGLDGTHQLDLSNQEEVDEFISANPVPEWYHAGSSPISIEWEKKVKELKKSRVVKKNARASGGFRNRQKSPRWR